MDLNAWASVTNTTNMDFRDARLKLVAGRVNREMARPLPQMKINPAVKDIHDFKFEDFELVGYDPHPGIKAPVAI